MVATEFYSDFFAYYQRALALNMRTAGLVEEAVTGDDLQDNVPIYDTVWRRYAGFSKVLEQLWYGPESWTKRKCETAWRAELDPVEWIYICIVHRITGSGASFEPDHGYRNSLVIEMVESTNGKLDEMISFVESYDKPFFTSIGNQIPPFNKKTGSWDMAGREYLCVHAPKLAAHLKAVLSGRTGTGIKDVVDESLRWQRDQGMKQFKFCLTAVGMDMAEYFPANVDRASDVYLGANAIRSLKLMFDGIKQSEYVAVVRQLCDQLNNHPYSMEDVLCDMIRYWNRYVPKAYRHREYATISTLRIS